jgi:hypothetical protein
MSVSFASIDVARFPSVIYQPDWKSKMALATNELLQSFEKMKLTTESQRKTMAEEIALTNQELATEHPELVKIISPDLFEAFLNACALSVFDATLDDRISHRQLSDTGSQAVLLNETRRFFEFHDPECEKIIRHINTLETASQRM